MRSHHFLFISLICVFLLLCVACNSAPEQSAEPTPPDEETQLSSKEDNPIKASAETLLSSMTLEDKIYQLFFVTPEALTDMGCVTAAGETTKNAIKSRPIGGVIYFAKNFETPAQTKDMLSGIQSFSRIPLFLAVDEEGGRVSRLGANSAMNFPHLPPMGTIGASDDTGKAYDAGLTIGRALFDLGLNVDFAPVADVLIHPNNTEIGDRSFSADPQVNASMVSAFTKGLIETGIAPTLKHFPGHGATVNNSHLGRTESTRTLEEMRTSELLPFISGIEAGADFIMVSHLTATQISDKPCTLSSEIMTDLLRTELGYEGIIITDSMQMGAITNSYSSGEAAVMALSAGADMILMPYSLTDAVQGVKNAVEKGTLSEYTINEKVYRILNIKEKYNLLP
ncbi:MAG: glycoside hydrolase family 3 protein [Clostridia bacterium]|nr:glycoside hydrolase family 3 protein [Clostridia bacterium]